MFTSDSATACFFEDDPQSSIIRRAAAEGAGTFFLAVALAATGAISQRLVPFSPFLGVIVGAVVVAPSCAG